MFNILNIVIRKLFLVKEIISKKNEVHFRRYRLIKFLWLAVYLHQICKSDMEHDMHDHPWNFISFILKGKYFEYSKYFPYFRIIHSNKYHAGNVIKHKANDVHKLSLITNQVWTLVFTYGKPRLWGYRLKDGSWIDHKKYRQIKNLILM